MRRKEWDGAYFCGACDELLVVDDQAYCHKCGTKQACDHDRGFLEYCAECGRTTRAMTERGQINRLREVLTKALWHVEELRDAWQSGSINECDGKGGTRSNRNVEVELAIRAALADVPAEAVTTDGEKLLDIVHYDKCGRQIQTSEHPFTQRDCHGEIVRWGYWGDHGKVWRPTFDPVASQSLKESMRAKGWRFEVSSSDSEPLFHRAIFQRIVGDKSGAWIIAEDPSELRAVALAACRALGVEGV